MKTLIVLLSLVWLSPTFCQADYFIMSNGRVIKDAEATNVTATTIELSKKGSRTEYQHSEFSSASLKKLSLRIAAAKRGSAPSSEDSVAVWTTKDRHVYRGVTISEVEADHVLIKHAKGTTRINIANVPDGVLPVIKDDLEAAKMAAAVIERQRQDDPGQVEWVKAAASPTASKAHKLSIVVAQKMRGGVVVERVSKLPDVTPGLVAFIEGMEGAERGMKGTITVVRAGVFWDAKNKGWPKYRVQFDASGILRLTTPNGDPVLLRPRRR